VDVLCFPEPANVDECYISSISAELSGWKLYFSAVARQTIGDRKLRLLRALKLDLLSK